MQLFRMAILEGPVNYLADLLDSPADGVRLVTGLIFSQIFAILHREIFSKISDQFTKRTIHLLLGLFLGFYVWDMDCLHHCASAVGFYTLFFILPWDLAVKVNFMYQLGYLLVGYYYNNMVINYSINWTTSQAIVTLKMIGLGFDLNDHKKDGVKLPGLLAVLGYVFFMGTYLVGPLDDFKRFEAFFNDSLFGKGKLPSFLIALKRLAHGIFYLVLSLITTSFLKTDFMFTTEFQEIPLVMRILFVTAWGHCILYKYLGVWCIAESTCMYIGYTFNGEGRWDGLRNVATAAFHKAVKLQDVIDTWNINTSSWCAKHIYKRCKFLGNKGLSQLITMAFLAMWHGLHLGYFVCFFQEFFYMFMEKGLQKNALVQKVGSILPGPVATVISWFYTKLFLSFALVGFELYYYERIMHVYRSIYFICPAISVLMILSNAFFVQKPPPEKSD